MKIVYQIERTALKADDLQSLKIQIVNKNSYKNETLKAVTNLLLNMLKKKAK